MDISGKRSGKNVSMLDAMKEQLERVAKQMPNIIAPPDIAARLLKEHLPYGVEIIESEYVPKGTVYIVAKMDDGGFDASGFINVEAE